VNPPPAESYDLRITPEGLRHLNHLPTKIRDAALAALHGPIRENPHRSGKTLVGELAGLFSARRGGYRIIYSIDDGATIVIVHRIAHRRSVYRRPSGRPLASAATTAVD
jgi:mRNA-degrading endonuclease RelE of RelBE toxin-antitoxin system